MCWIKTVGRAFISATFRLNFIPVDWKYNTIWFDQIKPAAQLTWHFDKRNHGPLSLKNERYLTTWSFKRKGECSFEALPASPKLLYLQLNRANVADFRAIERFPSLKRLELHHCLKLESDRGIAVLRNSLEILHINLSRKLHAVEEIAQLSGLKVLRLNDCGPLASIKFIMHFPNLLDFSFVNTNIVDGDLSPILEHPTLKSVGFLNKRHYNYTSEKIDDILRLRHGDETKDKKLI
jgi:hypothetical protein